MAAQRPDLRLLGSDEQDVRQRFHEGDRAAWRALAERYLSDATRLCLHLVGNVEEAEELSQEAVVQAFVKCRSYDPRRPFRPWLLTIAANLCRSRLRGPWWRRWGELVESLDDGPDPERIAVSIDSDRRVQDALAQIPPIYREALVVFHLQDLSYAEMAELTGVGVPALKQRVRRGLVLLEETLRRLYPDLLDPRKRVEGVE